MTEGTSIEWIPALAFLGVGLVAGGAIAWRARRRGTVAAPVATPLDLRDLVGRRNALVGQLRELEDVSGTRNPEQLARERYALELALARTLQALDASAPSLQLPQAPVQRMADAANSAIRGFFWGIGSAAALGLLLYLVSQAATPRGAGGPVTGNTPAVPRAVPDAQVEERELQAAVARSPDDVEARLRLTRWYLTHHDMMAVWRETQEILAKTPGNPQALSYQALVRLSMGQGDVALEMLKKALRADPDDLETYIHLGLVYARLGRPKDSDAAIAEAARRFPDQAAMLRGVQQEIRQAAQRTAGADTEGTANPHERAAPPEAADTAVATSVDRPSGEPRISGVIDVDPSLAGKVAAGTVIFVFVREAGFGAGPPIAAKRLIAGTFPIPFTIAATDSMRGDPIPAEVLLEARADADGDPMTRSPDDPVARADDLKTPATDVHLVLKRRQ